jgi:hypothetical protein
LSKPYYVSEDGKWFIEVVSFRGEGGSIARLHVFRHSNTVVVPSSWYHFHYFDSVDDIDNLIGLANLRETDVDPRE